MISFVQPLWLCRGLLCMLIPSNLKAIWDSVEGRQFYTGSKPSLDKVNFKLEVIWRVSEDKPIRQCRGGLAPARLLPRMWMLRIYHLAIERDLLLIDEFVSKNYSGCTSRRCKKRGKEIAELLNFCCYTFRYWTRRTLVPRLKSLPSNCWT
jgi:hypothetical protein